jgi:hypothetical protein
VYLVGMHTALITPTPYFGAAEISQWEDRTDRGVLPLTWANPNGSDSNLNMVTLTQDGPLAVLQGQSKTLEVRIANAGAATMPFLLLLSRINLQIEP